LSLDKNKIKKTVSFVIGSC